ncbi:hypothetical protein M8C21_018463 [Ambrosia artemisiifolia]|uniref:O-fucosyltransferase family protein n=1 Tax=Ambrosia artemisiifolia TaxID=4212 RepID=A0AAD5BLU4_AMBAR|nr:hypothetical protein M8C21_018463 [Ambrosia artemisiifolia]
MNQMMIPHDAMDATFNYYTSHTTTTTTTSSSSSSSSSTGSLTTKPSRRRLNRRPHHSFRSFIILFLSLLLFLSGLITFIPPFFSTLYPNYYSYYYYHYPPGSFYRSHEVFQNLLHHILNDNSSQLQLSDVWRYKMKLKEHKPCLTPTTRQYPDMGMADKYLIIEANGGLNQQRASITIKLQMADIEFGDIYDEEHFISTLKKYVDVVRELPKELMEHYDFNISNISNFRVPAWASASYYLEQVYPVLKEQRILRIAPFANRLATSLPPHIQYLRCLTNYEALRFSIPITALGKSLVERMTVDSSGSGGKYASVHLRFEEDMVAFSCCVYDGGKYEQLEMDRIREKGWGDKFKRETYIIDPVRFRIDGRCPMTPLEVGMMLRGMGFSNTTPIYLASGKIYEADKNLAPLKKMFPLLHTKDLLASSDELASFQGFSSRLAALDYIVCLFSEVFVTTQGGNFPHFLMGHRRFQYGHAKTIIPDKRKLVVLLHNTSISWHAFKNEMQAMLEDSDHKGVAIPKIKKSTRKNSIYAHPFPECQCLHESRFSTEE